MLKWVGSMAEVLLAQQPRTAVCVVDNGSRSPGRLLLLARLVQALDELAVAFIDDAAP